MSDKYHIVLCTCPNSQSATEIAQLLVSNNLCACVSIIDGVKSIYQWQGKIETSEEQLLIIKSVKNAYPEIERTILENHPYELPEVIAVSIESGLPEYLSWISDIVRKN